jgi:hypothetical protein
MADASSTTTSGEAVRITGQLVARIIDSSQNCVMVDRATYAEQAVQPR